MRQSRVFQTQRIPFMDGLRGLAILLVILYHAYARWTQLVPFGDAYASFPLFRFGWIGVELFFLISGFVILMTLENCASFEEFMVRRWMRLFPAMLACSLLVFCTAPLLPERPSGLPVIWDMLPGLTFIDPAWWEAAIGGHQGVLEGAFWSLFVEFKFYVVFGFAYFYSNRRIALILLAVIYVSGSRLMNVIVTSTHFKLFGYIYDTADFMSGRYYAWFLTGALLYSYYKERSDKTFVWAVAAAALSISAFKGDKLIPVIAVLLLFIVAIRSCRIQEALGNPVLLFLGFISYPLYLIHENALVALTIKLSGLPMIPGGVLPIIAIAFVMLFAWFVAAYIEPWMRRKINAVYTRREAVAKPTAVGL